MLLDMDDGLSPVESYGLEGAETRIWPWASITKQVVAILVMQEVEAGRLDLNSPVSVWIDDWPEDGLVAPSLRQLLQHNSGLPVPKLKGAGISFGADRKPDTLAISRMLIEPARCLDSRSAPGGSFSYNNCDTNFAAQALETVTGETLETLFAERIARPLGLRNSGFVRPESEIYLTRSAKDKAIIAAYGASAALAGSAEDLLKLDKALLEGALLSADALAEMWEGDASLGYSALGQWDFDASLEGCPNPVRIIERRGTILSRYQSRNFILPEIGLAIVAFTPRGEDEFAFGEIWSGDGFSHDLLAQVACRETK